MPGHGIPEVERRDRFGCHGYRTYLDEYALAAGELQCISPLKVVGIIPPSAAVSRQRCRTNRQPQFEKIAGGRGSYNLWIINGKSWPDTNPLFTVPRGERYRLVMDNNSGDSHPVHLHRHAFELTKVGDKPTSGLMKDTISMPRNSKAETDFVADDPGPTHFFTATTRTTWMKASLG